MTRKVFHVVPSQYGWQIKYNGEVKETYSNKEKAIERGVAWAKNNIPSQLLIHRADGTIEDERTYGDDPYPPRG